MPVYMCRWENGEVSFVSAKSKKDACFLLDELGEAEPDDLHLVSDFMLSFKLTDDGDLEVSEMGEDTQDLFNQTIYPVLFQAKTKVDGADQATPQVKRRIIREAVREENTRLEGAIKRRLSKDPVARTLQEGMHMSAAVAERFAKSARAKREQGG
jgi:hypothetical protein